MSAGPKAVDVLAVLDVAATAIENSGGNVAYLREARAAVAALIEAAKVAEKELPELCQASEMLRAALSRIGGAK